MEFFGKKSNAMDAYDENKQQAAVESQENENNVTSFEAQKKKKMPFAIWEVAGKEYKMKLKTSTIKQLESKYKTNLMNIMGSGEGGMPALTVMLDIAYNAMKDWQHGIKADDVMDLFDKYLDEGGSQLQFYTSVYMNIFAVSGFFSSSLTEQMQNTLEEASEIL